MRRLVLGSAATALLLPLLVGCAGDPGNPDRAVPGADPAAGRDAIERYGCTSCHAIPGVTSVGDESIAPDLHDFPDRDFIAGQIPNRPEELIQWLRDPQAIEPGTLMPDLGVTEQEARDIAAYLYSR